MEKLKVCETCGVAFNVPEYRYGRAKYCSHKCSVTPAVAAPNCTCTQCGKLFHMKPSKIAKAKIGVFCSLTCAAKAKKTHYRGESNPNYKGKNTDSDGYKLWQPCAGGTYVGGKVKLHRAVCSEIIRASTLPKGVHVHHKDCDVANNMQDNLVILSPSDHKWLHKQFGVATLWAFERGKIEIEDIASWSDDPVRATYLLLMNVKAQALLADYFGGAEMIKEVVFNCNAVGVNFVKVDELPGTERGAGGFGSTGVA